MAPLAPIIGTSAAGWRTPDQPGEEGWNQVEQQKAQGAERALDAAPEEPQIEHVAEDVQLAMEEHAGQKRNRCRQDFELSGKRWLRRLESAEAVGGFGRSRRQPLAATGRLRYSGDHQ